MQSGMCAGQEMPDSYDAGGGSSWWEATEQMRQKKRRSRNKKREHGKAYMDEFPVARRKKRELRGSKMSASWRQTDGERVAEGFARVRFGQYRAADQSVAADVKTFVHGSKPGASTSQDKSTKHSPYC